VERLFQPGLAVVAAGLGIARVLMAALAAVGLTLGLVGHQQHQMVTATTVAIVKIFLALGMVLVAVVVPVNSGVTVTRQMVVMAAKAIHGQRLALRGCSVLVAGVASMLTERKVPGEPMRVIRGGTLPGTMD